jgi:hypothetical protein
LEQQHHQHAAISHPEQDTLLPALLLLLLLSLCFAAMVWKQHAKVQLPTLPPLPAGC